MNTIMYTIVILGLYGHSARNQQNLYQAQEINTKESVIFIVSDTTKVSIGDTIKFPIPLTEMQTSVK